MKAAAYFFNLEAMVGLVRLGAVSWLKLVM